MNTRSLKFRLVAWYAGWLTLLFIVFGIFVYSSLGYYLKKGLREALGRRVRQVTDMIQRSSLAGNSLGLEIQNRFAPEANNRFTRVTADGSVIYVSGPPADHTFDPAVVPAAPVMGEGESFSRRALADGTALFIVALSSGTKEDRLVIEEGASETPIRVTLYAWLIALVGGLALLIFGAVLGGGCSCSER